MLNCIKTSILLGGLITMAVSCTPGSDRKSGGVDTAATAVFLNANIPDSLINGRKFQQVPSIVANVDGSVLYAAWYSGGAAPGPGNFVTVSTSEDKGKTWKNDQLIVHPKYSSVRIFDPALWRDHQGQVRLYYGSAGDSLLWDGFGGVNALDISLEGKKIVYSNPDRLTDGVMSNKPVYIASKEFALFPVYVDPAPAQQNAGKTYPMSGAFLYSANKNGFNQYSSIALPDSLRIHDEPQVVEVSDKGDFLVLLRTTKGIYFANSSDFGKTWSEARPFTAAGPSTSSRFFIGKLASGNLLLVANASTTRNNMTASLSKDGGKTWPYQLLLDERENVSYPDADQTPDGSIHVVFDRDRTGAMDILYCRFTEDDILNGNQAGVFRTRIN